MTRLLLVILVIMPGVWSGDWGVTFYSHCAHRGTSLVVSCSYDYPSSNEVTSVTWSKGNYVNRRWRLTDISELASYQGRFEYLGNKLKNCTMRINDVRDSDEGAYFFSFSTTKDKWTSQKYSGLSVKGLTASVNPATVTEGQRVRLTCEAGCDSPRASIVWFRDGQPVTRSNFEARAEDAGRYHCAIRGQEGSRSNPVALDVQYAPKKVRLSVSPSGVIVRGSSVTFSCSSDANPAVTELGYSLYKESHFTYVAFGQNHTISDIQTSHNGLYYCKAWNGISWHDVTFVKSDDFNLDVQYRPENVSVSVDPLGRVAEGSSVNLTCSSSAHPAADYSWYRRTGSPDSSMVLVGSGQVMSLPSMEPSHTGHYICQARNPVGDSNSTELLLEMEPVDEASQTLPILAGVGVSVLVIFLVALVVLLCRKEVVHENKQQTVFENGRGSSSSAIKEQPESIYANVQSIPLYSNHSGQDPRTCGDQVVYSTVTVKPRETTDNSRDLQDNHTQSQTPGESDLSVIYATVTKPS